MGVVPKTTWKRSLKRLQNTKKHFPEGEIIHWHEFYFRYENEMLHTFYLKLIIDETHKLG